MCASFYRSIKAEQVHDFLTPLPMHVEVNQEKLCYI